MTGTFPTAFVSHGGGPWPYVDGMREIFAGLAAEFVALPGRLPGRPKAVLVISGHWEDAEFTVSSAARPGMEYDYFGFPEHTYSITYKAPGSPILAARVGELLEQGGLVCRADAGRGFDHGTFVPLALMFPDADVPVVTLSLHAGYDPALHVRAGKLLAPLRDEGVLILGSGLTYHNMRGFGREESGAPAEMFEAYLNDAVHQAEPRRNAMLVDWAAAPGARLSHPREDHLLPRMVVAGAAGADTGQRVFIERIQGVPMACYQFG